MLTIGVDTGGTFTDLIYQDDGVWRMHKLLSTPHNPAKAVLDGLKAAAIETPRQIVHGSTVATNAILERKGVKTALVTNTGFTDIIFIGRQNRSRLYDLYYRREPYIVPYELCFGVPGRILCSGEEDEIFDDDAARAVCDKIKSSGVESVAVSFLFSFLNSAHERRMAELLGRTGIPVSSSHEILSEFREFERTSTTLVNAYVSPKMQRYLSHLIDELAPEDTLRVMQSNGGSISAGTAVQESVRTILSGPAGGVVGAFEIGKQTANPKLITFDMGGTSTDVALIDGRLSMTLESEISGYPVKTPMIDIHTVGAGGGSIAALDAGGSLQVGPESAGADPGPICYGKGRRITVTDANLYLGRLIPEHFLGGSMRLYTQQLDHYFQHMAEQVSLEPLELAEGIIAVANANMERAIRVISVERGHDPREFTLFSFGGAGGLHAADLARHLNIPRVLIPKNPGNLSAVGMLLADIVKDYSRTVMLNAEDTNAATLQKYFQAMREKGKADLALEKITRQNMIFENFLDMRYEGQSFEIITPFTTDFIEAFHTRHERIYGYRNDKPIQIVNIRLRARGVPSKPQFKKMEHAQEKLPDAAFVDSRPVIFEGRTLYTPVYQRENLLYGNCIAGPAVVVEYSATLIVPPFAEIRVDEFGNIIMNIQHDSSSFQ